MGLFDSVLGTITHLADNRNARNINRDNAQASVMMQTGLDTQANKYTMWSNLSRDGSTTHTNMTWSASSMIQGLFGKGGGIGGMFGFNKTGADGSESSMTGKFNLKPFLFIGGAILTFFGLRRLFGRKGRKKRR